MASQDKRTLDVTILSPERLIFKGEAESVLLPGVKGVFEVLPYHKRLLSKLLRGQVIIDGKKLLIKRGVVKVGLNEVIMVIEET